MTTAPAPAPRSSGALDLLVYTVAVGIGSLVWAAVQIARILGEEGPLVTVPSAEIISFARADASTTGFASVTMYAPATDAAGRAWLVASVVVVAVAAIIVMRSLMSLAFAVRQGAPFSRRTVRALTTIGVTLTVAVVAWPLLDGLGRSRALASLRIAYEPLHPLELAPLAPIFVAALAAAVLAAAFAQGERLQRDTEGLV